MPGLTGMFYYRSAERNMAALLDKMVAPMQMFPWYQTATHVSPAKDFAVAEVSLGILPRQPWLCGEESDGFARIEYDERQKTLTITNDQFGMMPVFYSALEDGLIFGTELKSLLAHPSVQSNLDERGLADLMAFGFLFGDKTLIKGIRCLPGGARLEVSGRTGQIKLHRTWDIREHIGRAHGSSNLLESINTEFSNAVQKRCAGGQQIGVSLSGGYDSRTIVGAVDHKTVPIKTLTLDVEGGGDQIISEQIAAVTNGRANHSFVENTDKFFQRWPQYVREMVWLTDGMYYDEACVMMSTLDRYREMGVQIVLRGHGGELSRMQWAYELACNRLIRGCQTQAALKDQLYRQMNFGLSEEDIADVFVPELAKAMRDTARASMEEAFEGLDAGWDPIDQVSCVFAQEYLRRQSAPSLMQLRSRVEVRMPFLDKDYVAAVLQLAPAGRLGTRVHRYLLAQHNPALLRITNANTGAPAGYGDLGQRLCRKLNIYLKQYLHYERYRHYVDVPGWLRGPLRRHVEDVLLDKKTLHRGLYNDKRITHLLEEHMSGKADRGAAILLLLTFELWNRLFIDGESWKGSE